MHQRDHLHDPDADAEVCAVKQGWPQEQESAEDS